jgi:hypothetical protein
MEVAQKLELNSEKAVEEITRAARLLRQLSGHEMTYAAPTRTAISDGIARRWEQLKGRLERVPFSHEQATAALKRVCDGLPPSGPNNEQFRDCCIWEAARAMAKGRIVHLVTGDLAFYEARDKSRGLASNLRAELSQDTLNVQIHPTLSSFMDAVKTKSATLDEKAISLTIIPAVASVAYEKASRQHSDPVELVLASAPSIKGYATPTASAVAISFEVPYLLRRFSAGVDEVKHVESDFVIEGTCSYDPNTKDISDVAVSTWSESVPGWSRHTVDQANLERQYGPGRQRPIT